MALPNLLLLAAILFSWSALAAGETTPRQLTWDELHHLVGKNVSISLYGGGAVAGKVLNVEADALLLDVSKSTNPAALPKGEMRVPRDTLYVLDVHANGFPYRLLGFVKGNTGPRRTTVRIVHRESP